MRKLITIAICIFTFCLTSFSQTWDTLADMPVGLTFPVAVVLNGEIHVIGGGGPTGATDIHLRYKPSTDVWDTLAPVPYSAQQPAGAVLNGKIHYFGGGFPNSGTPLSSHYVYNPDNNTWTAAASLPIPRVIMEAAVINGKIYALSGQPEKDRVDVYDPSTNTWIPKNPLPNNSFWYSATLVRNNEIYRFGGGGYLAPADFVDKYDSVSDSWTTIASLPTPLHAPAGTSLNGFIYIAGGYYGGFDLDDVLLFNVNTATFSALTPLPVARTYHELLTIGSCIYCIGGNNGAFPNMNKSLLRNCNPGVSLEEISPENNVLVYPNPASEYISFKNSDLQDFNVEIFNQMGSKIIEFMIEKGTGTSNITNLKEGIYYYSAISKDNRRIFKGRFIVIR